MAGSSEKESDDKSSHSIGSPHAPQGHVGDEQEHGEADEQAQGVLRAGTVRPSGANTELGAGP